MNKFFVFKDHDKVPFGKTFQIRYKEPMGYKDCPYLYRWTLILFERSIRLHHWLRSDDRRYYHDHSADLISIVLKGKYKNVNPIINDLGPDEKVKAPGHNEILLNRNSHPVEGIFNSWKNFFNMKNSIWFSKASVRHYLDIPEKGAWTLLLEGKAYNKWGFYVNGHKWRPLRYFHKFGIIQTKDYQ